jgi:hypothetical protein
LALTLTLVERVFDIVNRQARAAHIEVRHQDARTIAQLATRKSNENKRIEI